MTDTTDATIAGRANTGSTSAMCTCGQANLPCPLHLGEQDPLNMDRWNRGHDDGVTTCMAILLGAPLDNLGPEYNRKRFGDALTTFAREERRRALELIRPHLKFALAWDAHYNHSVEWPERPYTFCNYCDQTSPGPFTEEVCNRIDHAPDCPYGAATGALEGDAG